MSMSRDFPLPIAEPQAAAALWPVEQEPTTLICLWPGAQPTRMEVLAALSAAAGMDNFAAEELPHNDAHVAWNAVVQPDANRVPWIIWCEPAKPLPPGELSDPAAEQ